MLLCWRRKRDILSFPRSPCVHMGWGYVLFWWYVVLAPWVFLEWGESLGPLVLSRTFVGYLSGGEALSPRFRYVVLPLLSFARSCLFDNLGHSVLVCESGGLLSFLVSYGWCCRFHDGIHDAYGLLCLRLVRRIFCPLDSGLRCCC